MKIKVMFSPTNQLVPFDNQGELNRYFLSRCLGNNNKFHGKTFSVTISSLMGGDDSKDKNAGIWFKDGAFVIISAYEGDEMAMEFVSETLSGIIKKENKELAYGMMFDKYLFLPQEKIYDQKNGGFNWFTTLGNYGIRLTRKGQDGKREFLMADHPDFERVLNERTKKKLSKIDESCGWEDVNIKVKRDGRNIYKPKKIVFTTTDGKTSYNRSSLCSLFITGPKKAVSILTNIGLGESTKCGFGSICSKESREGFYKMGNESFVDEARNEKLQFDEVAG